MDIMNSTHLTLDSKGHKLTIYHGPTYLHTQSSKRPHNVGIPFTTVSQIHNTHKVPSVPNVPSVLITYTIYHSLTDSDTHTRSQASQASPQHIPFTTVSQIFTHKVPSVPNVPSVPTINTIYHSFTDIHTQGPKRPERPHNIYHLPQSHRYTHTRSQASQVSP